MKVCIVSDSHDRADALAHAVRDAKAEGAEAVIHCGDLIGAQTVKPALAYGLPVHVIHGNNVGDPQALHFQMHESGGLLRYHGPDARLKLGGRRIFVVHYPEYGHAMACTGDWDLVCCGHSHASGVERARWPDSRRLRPGRSVTWPRCAFSCSPWPHRPILASAASLLTEIIGSRRGFKCSPAIRLPRFRRPLRLRSCRPTSSS
jgi:putative phosphoesterase